ncbi:hypothetical protein IQ254_06915 [Nodosilinea sp. LEGE 07088]|uniref:trypco2 family protein n=1 Tax=Nodosilinea sp. LEGE 07088 TaxID=2777968 RepID=UPI00188037BE|nr:trypco2 family protein [Nodosilinea sp. LEGE 07088]MBE9136934.1 hypothetical protein [Nodosilinea sp. LEGE 07088]
MSSDNSGNAIGLAELVEQVKQELLSAAPSKDNVPILFVDSVELQLQVTVKRERQSKVKVEVVAIGGVEVGGGGSRNDVHQVIVKMSPLFTKDKVLEFYQTLHPDQIPPMVMESVDILLKGSGDNLDQQF